MKTKLISHTDTKEIQEIISFMVKSELLFNPKYATKKESHEIILKNLFDENSKFLILTDDSFGEILACATITIQKDYPGSAFIGNYHLPVNASNREEMRKHFFKEIYSFTKSIGADSLVGPINFNTWFSNRFKYPTDSELLPWEPSNPAEYPEDFMKEEFVVDKKYFSYFISTINDIDVFKPHHQKILDAGFRLTSVDITNEENRKILYQLNCECFNENYMYTGINYEQYKNTHLASLKGANLNYSAFIENDERKWGYIFNIPIGNQLVVKTILVSPLCRAGGIGSALIYGTADKARQDGLTLITGALVRDGNASQFFFKNVSTPYQINEYLLFKKVLK